jgi:hypothetical protein
MLNLETLITGGIAMKTNIKSIILFLLTLLFLFHNHSVTDLKSQKLSVQVGSIAIAEFDISSIEHSTRTEYRQMIIKSLKKRSSNIIEIIDSQSDSDKSTNPVFLTDKEIFEIGIHYNVTHVLTSSLVKLNDIIIVSTNLISTKDCSVTRRVNLNCYSTTKEALKSCAEEVINQLNISF